MLKKNPAEPGIIAQTDIAPGEPAAPAGSGTEIRPVESTLLGDGTDQHPPAARKAQDAPEDKPAEPVVRDAPALDTATVSTPVSTAAPAQKVTVRKTGFWPVFLGGVVAAGLGSAATIWALPHLPAGWLPEQPESQVVATAAPEIDVAAIRSEAVAAAQAATSEQIDALRAEIAQAPAAPETPAGPSAEDLAALRQQVESQAARIQELAARPQIDPDIAARVQTLAEQADTLEQQLQTAAQAAQARINAAQAEAQQLQEAAAESTRRAEAVAAVAALQAALDRGVTPDEARQTLEGAGLEAPEALTREVPSLDSLQASFPEAARAALRASLRQDSAAGNGSLFGNFIRAQTGARSVEPREGTDPDAILSRANAAVEEGRIGDAVTEIEALPEPGKTATAMAEWLAGATAYRDAQAALSDLSAPAN
ncbi:hypothetical protein RAH32_11840 [Paracoccus sp. WLY502]|uniref:COG4223 family protein n=1 Tax=Paracoccus yibinensis TaxID=3068891 RepID=UPI002796923B|nr:hypothetical protein [Paracoccus sp. WLY502]MDQ1901134.1 hypothetical protein [Paracoccus sp. WLY502]